MTLTDWMNNMTPKDRKDWIQDTFVRDMKQARRPAKFIHRSVLASSHIEMRRQAISLLKKAAEHWAEVVAVTGRHYRPIPAVQLSRTERDNNAVFSWQQYQDQVERDIRIAANAE